MGVLLKGEAFLSGNSFLKVIEWYQESGVYIGVEVVLRLYSTQKNITAT